LVPRITFLKIGSVGQARLLEQFSARPSPAVSNQLQLSVKIKGLKKVQVRMSKELGGC
jgi:hypothetical protein